ncbi:MAG: ammonia-forming cytochrome c nitrite reductase subunit c552 [Melioribacteraceae bacterium]|nr:ammonia-forming cytochrome c nitrite reductase subunit c552 [Melioribacteraceae bacterium]
MLSKVFPVPDCHMPYKTEGGVKFTDHHIQSPLNNIEKSCFDCHHDETEQLIKMVYSRQDQNYGTPWLIGRSFSRCTH